ncbi:hypothetical protein [Streptomyces sp. CB01580]|uniref:hypothetical protein n=1 Tax=Streptomyces sp. CB01580 TaxID=1703933 RepID=UPI00093E6712|nr:hypothetical protein [Streptomyces sp. CB01580]OKJ31448.1 hypothetical protein AMK22_25470 [Streptomyces sp. CB01580]
MEIYLFRRRARADREFREVQRAVQALLVMHTKWPEAPATVTEPADTVVVPDFLPPDLRPVTRQDVEGFMMRWDMPLVIDDEVHACPCGAYRNWIVFNMRDDSVWLRCEAGHATEEPRLDTAWYNRNSLPVDAFHPTLKDGLRHLGH